MRTLSEVVSHLQMERQRIHGELARLDAAIQALSGGGSSAHRNGRGRKRPMAAQTASKPKKLSAAGRKRIAAAQRERWAAWRASQKKAA